MTLLPLENDLIQVQILSKSLASGYVNMEIKYLRTKRRKQRSYRSTARPRGRCTSFSSQTSVEIWQCWKYRWTIIWESQWRIWTNMKSPSPHSRLTQEGNVLSSSSLRKENASKHETAHRIVGRRVSVHIDCLINNTSSCRDSSALVSVSFHQCLEDRENKPCHGQVELDFHRGDISHWTHFLSLKPECTFGR